MINRLISYLYLVSMKKIQLEENAALSNDLNFIKSKHYIEFFVVIIFTE